MMYYMVDQISGDINDNYYRYQPVLVLAFLDGNV